MAGTGSPSEFAEGVAKLGPDDHAWVIDGLTAAMGKIKAMLEALG